MAVPATADSPARLAVFLSGSGRTLLNLVDAIRAGRLHATIPLVVASRECLGAERARQAGLHTEVIRGDVAASRLLALCREHRIDFVVLAGYLRLLPVPRELDRRMVNIHPALLPDFGGPGMYGHHVHAAVIASGRTRSGCTVHLCSAEYDRGAILHQRFCPVHPDDTPETLAARVFELECQAYPEALELLVTGRIKDMNGAGSGVPTSPAPPRNPAG